MISNYFVFVKIKIFEIMKRDSKNTEPCYRLRKWDIYGQQIDLFFMRQKQFTTWIGFCLTVATMVGIIAFAAVRAEKLVSDSDPFLSKNTLPRDNDFKVNLDELGYVFAVSKIDEKAASIVSFHTIWPKGDDKKKIKRKVELKDCAWLLENRARSSFSKPWLVLLDSLHNDRLSQSYLCPIYPESFIVRGNYISEFFEYGGISVKGC